MDLIHIAINRDKYIIQGFSDHYNRDELKQGKGIFKFSNFLIHI